MINVDKDLIKVAISMFMNDLTLENNLKFVMYVEKDLVTVTISFCINEIIPEKNLIFVIYRLTQKIFTS